MTAIENSAKKLLGLEWQIWAASLSGLAGVVLLLYCTKNCCPFWSWAKTAVQMAWWLLKCGFRCGWCLVKLLPRGDSAQSIRKEEARSLLPVFFNTLLGNTSAHAG